MFEINELRQLEAIITDKAPNVLDSYLFKGEYNKIISSVNKIIRLKEQEFDLNQEKGIQTMEKKSMTEIKQEMDSILQHLYFRKREEVLKGREEEINSSEKGKLEEDISFSHSADIYVVTLYDDKTWSCTCPFWNKEHQECDHIKQYKAHYFDPSWIPDALDNYIWLDDLHLEHFTLEELVDEFPRWIIEYLFEEYEYRELDSTLCTTPLNIEKIYYALNRYREIEKMKIDITASNKL